MNYQRIDTLTSTEIYCQCNCQIVNDFSLIKYNRQCIQRMTEWNRQCIDTLLYTHWQDVLSIHVHWHFDISRIISKTPVILVSKCRGLDEGKSQMYRIRTLDLSLKRWEFYHEAIATLPLTLATLYAWATLYFCFFFLFSLYTLIRTIFGIRVCNDLKVTWSTVVSYT
jgi:hypothetical protein